MPNEFEIDDRSKCDDGLFVSEILPVWGRYEYSIARNKILRTGIATVKRVESQDK